MRETLADKIAAMQRRMVAGTALARRKAFLAAADKRRPEASAEGRTAAPSAGDERAGDSAEKP
jgi:hypothetical protein